MLLRGVARVVKARGDRERRGMATASGGLHMGLGRTANKIGGERKQEIKDRLLLS